MLLGQTDAARDAEQEVFLRLLTGLDSFKKASSPVTWIYRITTNICIDELRRRSRRNEVELSPRVAEALAGDRQSSPDRALAAKRAALELLKNTDEQSLQIFVHAHLDEMTQEDIARLLGLSRKTVWSKLNRLRRQIEACEVS